MYCGKEIGAFRQLRDSEFCSVVHRKKYGERLGKALHAIATPEPAPAGVAGFRIDMPLQRGNLDSARVPWQTVSARSRIRIATRWPLTIDPSNAPADTETAPVECPPPSQFWLPVPGPEPVSAFVRACAALACAPSVRLASELKPVAIPDDIPHSPAACRSWMAAPLPEPAFAFVQASTAPACTPSVHRLAAEPRTVSLPDDIPHSPAPCRTWMPTPGPEPVAAFVQAAAGLAPAITFRSPRFALEPAPLPIQDLPLDAPPACLAGMPSPAPEPVAALVKPAASLSLAHTACLPVLAVQLGPAPIPDLAPLASIPAPEPVTDLVRPAVSLSLAHPQCLPRLAAVVEPAHILDPALLATIPASEPVAAFLSPAAHLFPASATSALRFGEFTLSALPDSGLRANILPMPVWPEAAVPAAPAEAPFAADPLSIPPTGARVPLLEVAADLEPSDLPLDPPAMLQRCMPAPPADPVFSHPHASTAPAAPLELQSAIFDLAAAVHAAPSVARPQFVQYAEPANGSRPGPAQEPAALVPQAAAVALPAVPPVALEPFAATRLATPPAAPEAVECWLLAAGAAVPLSTERAARCEVELAASLVVPEAVPEPAPEMCRPLAGPAPAPVESVMVASAAEPISLARRVRMLPFGIQGSRVRTVSGFDARRLAPAPHKPYATAPRQVAPPPIATVKVSLPSRALPEPASGLPRPGVVPVDFHLQRLRHTPVARPESVSTRPTLVPPQFLVRYVPEKLEDPAAQPKAPRRAPVVEILNMPAAKRPPSVLMVFGRVAAGFLLAVSVWYGIANLFGNRRLVVHEEVSTEVAVAAGSSTRSGNMSGKGASAQPAPTGTMARVRQAIANRAALRLAEPFRSLENWDNGAKANPQGWSRHPDGYVNTGALALFRPSIKFTDYRMEFFGQIEAKSIGWTVRASDTRNFHAMKLTVMEAGMRPFVALVHYNVVDGKSGRRTQTPLNIMVHNNKPMQFAVDVKGNRFVTSIDGEEVDSFIDNTLVAGGVGFFSEAGEHARLYWMKVSRNTDWLGGVCAMLSDSAAVTTADALHTPALPGGAPAPFVPGDKYPITLAAAWTGVPCLRAARKSKFFKTWRSEPWNS